MPTSWWQSVRKIATLPGVMLTPELVLARNLEKARGHLDYMDHVANPKIKSVWVGIQWWDDSYAYDYSLMTLEQLNMHRLVLDMRLREIAETGGDVV